MNSDFKDLLKILGDSQVEYLIVGGYAVIEYTEPRYTKDIDIWIAANSANARRVYAALKEFGAPLFSTTENDFAEEGFFFQIGRPPSRIDILMSIPGLKFTDAWARRNIKDIDGIKVNFISREDLITNKLTVGRPQDLADVESLKQGVEK